MAPRTACRTAVRSGQGSPRLPRLRADRPTVDRLRPGTGRPGSAVGGRVRSAPVPSVARSITGASAASIVSASMRGLIRESLTKSEEKPSFRPGGRRRPAHEGRRPRPTGPCRSGGAHRYPCHDPHDQHEYPQFPRGNGRRRTGGLPPNRSSAPSRLPRQTRGKPSGQQIRHVTPIRPVPPMIRYMPDIKCLPGDRRDSWWHATGPSELSAGPMADRGELFPDRRRYRAPLSGHS